MKLSDDIKNKIKDEFNHWIEVQYAGKTKEERQKFGQFFTPPELTIRMIEKFSDLNGNVFDPTVGCGGLLAACIIAGANPRKCYGIELDESIALLCRDRLAKLGVPRFNIKVGNALENDSYNFNEELQNVNILYFKVEDLGLCKVKIFIELNVKNKVSSKEIIINYSKDEDKIKLAFEKIYKIFNQVNENNFYICSEKLEGRLKFIKAFFKKYLNKKFEYDKKQLINL